VRADRADSWIVTTKPARTLLPLLLALVPATATASPDWLLTADAPAAVAVSRPQNDWFAAGALPSLSLARAIGPGLLVGARLRAGVMAEGGSPAGGLADKGMGGLSSLTLGARIRPLAGARLGQGLWFDVAAGGALTGRDARATAELGVGWGVAAGAVVVGPSVRYLHVLQPDDQVSPGDARLVLIGLEMALFDRRQVAAERLVVSVVAPPRRAVPRVAEVPPADRDGDFILDVDDACPQQAEVENGVDDRDGCPDQGLFEVIEDRITLDETVLFRTGRAGVSRRGREVLSAIAGYLAEHPELVRVDVEGHADERGPDQYNLNLSQLRGERVRAVLVQLGVRAEVQVSALGESSPRASGSGESAWRQNRRVEFVLVRRQPRTAEVSR
jgi:outer membrane protein OmpA-like peptidoglycan-associated protein